MTTEYPDRLKKFFDEVEARRTLLTTITETHNKLINNFISIDETLTRKSETLDTQIENFRKYREETLEALRLRENEVPEKEVSLAARVEHLKDSSIKDIEGANNLDQEEKTVPVVLRMLFRRMDSKNLMKFLLAKRKESVAVRAEIMAAAEESVDLLGFVLQAVEEFVELKVSGVRVKGMADRRWSCAMVIQAGLPLLEDDSVHPSQIGVSTSLKERARKVLDVWKEVVGGGEGSGGVGSGEATMFLQVVVGFGLKDMFDYEFLRRLVLEFASRREMAKLAVSLGFGGKIKDIIDELVKTGREIEAVYFACEAGLTDQYPPPALLKSSLQNFPKNTKDVSSLVAINNELNVIRAIIKCIEDHKLQAQDLESQFTIENLQKRIDELERLKSDKRRGVPSSPTKPSKKRHRERGGGGGSSRPPKSVRLAMASRQRNQPGPPSHHPPATRFSAPYNYTNPSVYESNAPATSYYGGANSQSPARYGMQYANPSQDVGAAGARVDGYGARVDGYGVPGARVEGYGAPGARVDGYGARGDGYGAPGVRGGGYGASGAQVDGYGGYDYNTAPAGAPPMAATYPAPYQM